MPVTNSTNLVHLNTHTGNEKSITNGNRKAPAGKCIGNFDWIFYVKKRISCLSIWHNNPNLNIMSNKEVH